MNMDEETFYLMNPWWEGKLPDTGVPRSRYVDLLQQAEKRKQIEIVLGGRRVGKTTLVKQCIVKWLERGLDANDILYMAMDHPRTAGTSISELLRAFRALFGHSRNRRLWLFLDEVQESPSWEAELKALYDT
jgi:predicted AAA+ superfamily ATPase